MEELRDRTADVLYENYRTNKLNTSGMVDFGVSTKYDVLIITNESQVH
jgi:septin family protein